MSTGSWMPPDPPAGHPSVLINDDGKIKWVSLRVLKDALDALPKLDEPKEPA